MPPRIRILLVDDEGYLVTRVAGGRAAFDAARIVAVQGHGYRFEA